jgi:5-methyltetrahydrofolate--homocysteine methyltransferase
MHPRIQKMIAAGPVLTDGAWGTQLQAKGLEIGACPDAWNLSHPERVQDVARAYVQAGSQVILTNTFGSNRFMLARHGLADKVGQINRAGVEISCRAAAGKARVFAAMGPTGVILLTGETAPEEVQRAFADQARAIAAAGADAIVIETMSDLAEAQLAVQAAKATGLPVVACMTFDSGQQRDRTMMGVTPEQAAEKLAAAGADVIGANCGQGVEGFHEICRRLAAATDRPIWIKANAGLPQLVDGQAVYTMSPQKFALHVPALVDAGARFIGGCCGTTPLFIRAIYEALHS